MNAISDNNSGGDSKPAEMAPNSTHLGLTLVERIRQLESPSTDDPWLTFARLQAADVCRSNLAAHDLVKQTLTGPGTAVLRLSAAQRDIKRLLRGARQLRQLLTIELERDFKIKSAN